MPKSVLVTLPRTRALEAATIHLQFPHPKRAYRMTFSFYCLVLRKPNAPVAMKSLTYISKTMFLAQCEDLC